VNDKYNYVVLQLKNCRERTVFMRAILGLTLQWLFNDFSESRIYCRI